jgi:hypothetical protein
MISFADWFVPTIVGVTFTLIGFVKLYGVSKGLVGGANQPFVSKVCGT